MAARKLTDKQRLFIEHYFTCGMNGTEAARRAGYAGDDRTLASVASENLRKPDIRSQIEARFEEVAMPAKEVLARLADQARSSMGDFMEIQEDGKIRLKLKEASANGKLHLIKKIKVEETLIGPLVTGQVVSLELYDAQSALQLIGKHHSLFVERSEHTGKDGGPIEHKFDLSGLSDDQLSRLADSLKD